MPVDYTVITAVRQRLGDDKLEGEFPVEPGTPLRGTFKEISFSCPDVARGAIAVLQFQAIGVQDRNIIRINGNDITGGISGSPQLPDIKPRISVWNTHSLLVAPNVLNEENVLRIESVPNATGNFDDFAIDNIVIFFKTRGSVVG